MWEKTERDLCAALSYMDQLARERTNFNQTEAKEKLKGYMQQDRRFDEYDKDALAARVMLSKSNGAALDLSDPRLKGRPPRPLDPSNW
jgi:hypothetical protein